MNRRLSFYNTEAATEHYLGIRWPRRIWESVLVQAIEDAVVGPTPEELSGWGGNPAGLADSIKAAAQEWVDDEVNEPRRFVWVCEQLNLDPAAVRQAIRVRKGGGKG